MIKSIILSSVVCVLMVGCAATRHKIRQSALPETIDLSDIKLQPDPSQTQLSLPEIERLIVACALLDVPRSAGDWRLMIGLPKSVRPSVGRLHADDDHPMTVTKLPLRDQPDGSRYVLKAYFSLRDSRLLRVDVALEIGASTFVPDPQSYPLRHIHRLKEMMREERLTPAEFTERLPEFLQRERRERRN